MNPVRTALGACLAGRLPPAALAWLDEAQTRLAAGEDLDVRLPVLSARCLRKVGDAPLGPAAPTLDTGCGPLDLTGWTAGTAARMMLVLSLPDPAAGAWTMYRAGDERERCDTVRGLALVGDAAPLDLALDAGRTNAQDLFRALSLDNPFPAARYDDAAFNHLVLKALFMDLDIDRVAGLDTRANADLSRMCEDFADERLAAGRPVPPSLWLAAAPFASPHGTDMIIDHARSADTRAATYARRAMTAHRARHQAFNEALASPPSRI